MAQFVVIDELQVTLKIPDDLSEDQVSAVRTSLMSKAFYSRLLKAVKQVVATFPSLESVRVQVSR